LKRILAVGKSRIMFETSIHWLLEHLPLLLFNAFSEKCNEIRVPDIDPKYEPNMCCPLLSCDITRENSDRIPSEKCIDFESIARLLRLRR
jgi:hypothetical protein